MKRGHLTFCDFCHRRISFQKFISITKHGETKHYHNRFNFDCWMQFHAQVFVPKKQIVQAEKGA